jgi:hypothetical protein
MVIAGDETDDRLPGELAGDAALAAVIGELIRLVFERIGTPSFPKRRHSVRSTPTRLTRRESCGTR